MTSENVAKKHLKRISEIQQLVKGLNAEYLKEKISIEEIKYLLELLNLQNEEYQKHFLTGLET